MTPADDVLSECEESKTSKSGDPMVRQGGHWSDERANFSWSYYVIAIGLLYCLLLPLDLFGIPLLLGGLAKPRLERVGGN